MSLTVKIVNQLQGSFDAGDEAIGDDLAKYASELLHHAKNSLRIQKIVNDESWEELTDFVKGLYGQ